MSQSKPKDYRIGDDALWARAWLAPLVLAIAGGLVAYFTASPDRLGFAYLFALFTTVTFMLGGIFLVLIQFLTAAHWGISSRRIAEVIMSGAPVVALLAVPFIVWVALGKVSLYQDWQSIGAHADSGPVEHGHPGSAEGSGEHGTSLLGASAALAQAHEEGQPEESHGAETAQEHGHTLPEVALHHEVLADKTAYLNTTGWVIRAIVYFALWTLIAWAYFGWSRRQDEDHDPKHTVRMQRLAAPGIIVFALALTFASFDWVMSLEPSWFSTIFGVVIFAGSAVSILALTILIGLSFYRRGLVGDAINTEHFHDLAKLLFGFICFWTYVQFSQWMLIWYAGIPEEATWFHKRWDHGWKFISLLLIFGHFVAPFVLLISRVQKRALPWLQVMCFWVIFMHIVDIYWFVLPQAGRFSISPADVGALLFVAGIFFAYVFWQLGRVPLVPVGDPRLSQSLHHHQTH